MIADSIAEVGIIEPPLSRSQAALLISCWTATCGSSSQGMETPGKAGAV